MTRKFTPALLAVAACAGISPAQAGPSTFAVTGSVTSRCTLATPSPSSPMVLTGSVATNGNLTIGSPNSWTVSGRCNSPSNIRVSAQSLRKVPPGAVGNKESQTVNYTATASGWTTTPATVTTNDTNAVGTTTAYQGTAQTSSSAREATVTITTGAFNTVQNGSPTKLNAGSYQSTITLTLTPN